MTTSTGCVTSTCGSSATRYHEAILALARNKCEGGSATLSGERKHIVPQRIDHIVIAVRELAQASADYEAAGFTVTPGGEHTGGATHNALVTFDDGAYFELIAFKEPDRPQPHRWWEKMANGEGLVDFALLADDLAAEAARLRDAGIAIEGPVDGGRLRPDGQRIAWRTVLPSTAVESPLPFLIEDVTPRELRVPGGAAARHRLDVAGVAGIVVAVADLDHRAPLFASLLGPGEPATNGATEGVRRAHRFGLGERQWIELVEPDDANNSIGRHLRARGEGPYEIVLDGAERGSLLAPDWTHGARIRIAGSAL